MFLLTHRKFLVALPTCTGQAIPFFCERCKPELQREAYDIIDTDVSWRCWILKCIGSPQLMGF
jgi:hypothetical protein